jgi:hypothetical protein
MHAGTILLNTEYTECQAFSLVVELAPPAPSHPPAPLPLAVEGGGGASSGEGTDTLVLQE